MIEQIALSRATKKNVRPPRGGRKHAIGETPDTSGWACGNNKSTRAFKQTIGQDLTPLSTRPPAHVQTVSVLNQSLSRHAPHLLTADDDVI